MTNIQKVIKTIAICLAVILIVLIFNGILNVISWISNYSMTKKPNEGATTFKENYTEIQEIDIEATTSNIVIQSGKKFLVETKNLKSNFSSKVRNNILKVEEENSRFQKKENRGTIIVTIPNETILNKLTIDTGTGKLEMNEIKVQELELDHGTGDVEIYNSTFETSEIDAGVGEIYIRNSTFKNSKIDAGIGVIDMEANLIGNNQINSGIGDIKLTLLGLEEDYTIKTEKGIGNITINDQKKNSSTTYGTGNNIIEVEGGIGSIFIYFEN